MFERNKVDNSREMGTIGVEITLDGGVTLSGKLAVPVQGSIADVLNNPTPFMEFEPYAGERIYLAKASLRAVRPLAAERVPALANRVRDIDGFDPWQALGVAKGAAFEKVKVAFHRAALAYHPDRYASAELPAEVRAYLEAMARRINQAYAVLEQAHEDAQRTAALRTQPIYASGQR